MLVTSHNNWLLMHAADQWLQVHLSRKKIKNKFKKNKKTKTKNVSNGNVKQFFDFCMIHRFLNKVLKLSAKL